MSSDENQQYFAEYSLWNDSAYSRNVSLPLIQFAKPVYEDSIFLAPSIVEPATVNNAVERDKQPNDSMVIPWYSENFFRKTQDVVQKDDLYKDPDLFYEDEEEEASSPDEAAPEAGPASTRGRARRQPSTHASKLRNGHKSVNVMQRRLEKALSQPARIDRGATILERMGWEGGGLGRDGNGIIEPITPNITNQLYSHLGLGAEEPPPTPPQKSLKRPKKPTLRRKEMIEAFKTNLLLSILEFVKNDLQSELLFDAELKKSERKKIHSIIAALNGEEDLKKREDFDNIGQIDIVNEIHERNNYVLGTQSEGDPPTRQIIIYKEAQDHTYLVTPEDIRYTEEEEEEEETNPFLRSITKHMKPSERGFTSDTPMLDKLIKFFIEFSEEEYTEFRFLGPFKVNETEQIGVFLGVIACLSQKQPLVVPKELLKAFEKIRYSVQEDINGYMTIKKTQQSMELSME